jgi:hypothetical protein
MCSCLIIFSTKKTELFPLKEGNYLHCTANFFANPYIPISAAICCEPATERSIFPSGKSGKIKPSFPETDELFRSCS